jgi:sorting nexin-8
LFADEPAFGTGSANFGGSSLFADDDGLGSPWNSNTAKRTSKQQLVKTLLPDSDVPESYIDAYDLVLSAGERAGTGVSLTTVRELLSGGGLSATDQAKILNLVLSGDTDRSNGLGRGEFNVLLALIGLAQEGEDLTFDTVDDRRKSMSFAPESQLKLIGLQNCRYQIAHIWMRCARSKSLSCPLRMNALPLLLRPQFPYKNRVPRNRVVLEEILWVV